MSDTRRCSRCGTDIPAVRRNYYCRKCGNDAARERHKQKQEAWRQVQQERLADMGSRPAPKPLPMDDDEVTQPAGLPPPIVNVSREVPTCLVVLPDTHVPFEDPAAWALVLAILDKVNPDGLAFIGDFSDEPSVSFHDRDTFSHMTPDDEDAYVNKRLDEVHQATPRARRRHWVMGNHEYRNHRYLLNKAPGLPYDRNSLISRYRLPERGWDWTPYMQSTRIGPVTLTHTYKPRGGFSGTTLEHAYNMAGGSVLIGHYHRLASQAFGKGFAACLGWLGGVEHIKYEHRDYAERYWRHGLGIVWIDGGDSMLELVEIRNRKAFIGGKEMLRAA